MDKTRLARLGLWTLAAGNAWWTVVNAVRGNPVNVVTDIVIIAGCAIAALSLARAMDGVGPGGWRLGLALVALAHLAQNAYNLTRGLAWPDGVTLLTVLVASPLLLVGALRWTDDGWDRRALPWLAAGMAGIAFEPLWYTVRYAWRDPWQFGFGPGGILVLAGAGLCAWAFFPERGGTTPTVAAPPARPRSARKARA